MPINRKVKIAVIFFVGLVVTFTIGLFWLSRVERRLNDYVEHELESNNQMVIAAVNTERYQNLTFTEADNQNPDYVRLREQFIAMHQIMKQEYGIRSIYAMRVVGDKIVFFVDSVALDDSNHAEPGVEYEEPPQVLLDVIRDGKPRVYGPYTDEYGSYYSAFAPQYDRDGRVVAYMGTDIEVVDYEKMLNEELSGAKIALVGVVLIYLMSFVAVERLLDMRRRRRERELNELHRAEERENLLMNIGEGVVAFDESGKVIFANRFASDSVCGLDLECRGDSLQNRWSLLDSNGSPLPSTLQPYGKSAVEGFFGMNTVVKPHLKRFSGELFPVAVSIAKVDLGLATPATVMTYRDVTQEAEIDRMKSDFIGVAVHQLKTPLTALKWSVETLSEGAKSKRTVDEQRAIDDITVVTRRLNDLVVMLLDITRIESGRMTVAPKLSDLPDLAREVVDEVSEQMKKKQQEVRLVPAGDLPEIKVDSNLVREIYKNLLTNAIKYSPVGGHIEIRIEKSGEEIVTSVKDDGFGIPASDQKRVYDKFFRGRNVVGLPEEGTGLGLYFAKQLVEISGGRIWFESTEGVGTVFHFSLPLTGSEAREGTTRLG